MIVKKDGRRESFDRAKILSGLNKACEKRPVSVNQIEEILRDVETKLIESGEKEIPSELIGEFLIDCLRDFDPVAYVRFASVYREFSDVHEFMDTLHTFVSKASRSPKREKKNSKEQGSNLRLVSQGDSEE